MMTFSLFVRHISVLFWLQRLDAVTVLRFLVTVQLLFQLGLFNRD